MPPSQVGHELSEFIQMILKDNGKTGTGQLMRTSRFAGRPSISTNVMAKLLQKERGYITNPKVVLIEVGYKSNFLTWHWLIVGLFCERADLARSVAELVERTEKLSSKTLDRFLHFCDCFLL
jgi:hypothetical protein